LHEEVAPFVREAMRLGQYKVFPVLEAAGIELATRRGVAAGRTFLNSVWEERAESFAKPSENGALPPLTERQRAAQHLWFANLNTPEEFAEAERHVDALDT
jgi:molybdopterin-guanine dinucleotide biosynthesis protein A